MICVAKCVKNGEFPPFFVFFFARRRRGVFRFGVVWQLVGWAVEQGGFAGPGCTFVVSYYVVMIKMMVVRYTANIVQIIKSLSMWRRLRDDFVFVV